MKKGNVGRRDFLKRAATAVGAATQLGAWPTIAEAKTQAETQPASERSKVEKKSAFDFPRRFSGAQLKTIAFPLGGVAAGSVSLGGRGQLRDWEIYNRPNKGFSPAYAFPSVWVQKGNAKPVARVLEARILPPFDGAKGLGSDNVPGLSRLEKAEFRGAYPFANIQFEDASLPVEIELEAFSPFIPHDPEDSGLPVAILRYRVRNPGATAAKVAIAFSIDNPVKVPAESRTRLRKETRINEHQDSAHIEGLVMTNPGLAANDPMQGDFALATPRSAGARVTYWRGWPRGIWWNAPMLFWDAFSRNGALLEEPTDRGSVGALCVQRSIAPGESADFTFFLAWHFPNRTPEWCGWRAPKGEGGTVIGNHYCTRFKDAWQAADYAAENLERLEARTRAFADSFAESTLPAPVKDAASANLSTLATQVCFRTADGEFHGFEGADDKLGCCFGSCTHVWNYETATTFLFPSFSRSLRKAAFGYSMDDDGGIRFRQLLPDGKERWEYTAADGQMGQILHVYLDWKLSGDMEWLKEIWPRVKKGIEFSWIKYGWDPNRSGVLTGVQHNTYDVEFFGPNPLCGTLYLGALRACEEMARAMGEVDTVATYRAMFEKGSSWMDANLFQGEFYIQKVQGCAANEIASSLRGPMGSQDTENPQYQAGTGCLADQLIGQYLASVAGLGLLLKQENLRTTLESIYRYNYKSTLVDHDCAERTYALNNEAALTVCDYGKAERPHIPFPYYAEVWTGQEYLVASMMFFMNMLSEGLEVTESARARYDGEKRNPWDEEECGHHYARAMSSWSTVVALSGFQYAGDRGDISVLPMTDKSDFKCFWSTATGWGGFSLQRRANGISLIIQVLSGTLSCQSCTLHGSGSKASAHIGTDSYTLRIEQTNHETTLHFPERLQISEGKQLEINLQG